jgi:hypothetical protein
MKGLQKARGRLVCQAGGLAIIQLSHPRPPDPAKHEKHSFTVNQKLFPPLVWLHEHTMFHGALSEPVEMPVENRPKGRVWENIHLNPTGR